MGNGIIVKGEAIHHPVGALHNRIGPVVILGIRAAGNFVNAVVLPVILAHIGLIAPVFIGVIGRIHIAAAAPVFVADAEVFHSPRLIPAVFSSEVCHRGFAREGHILNPFAHFPDGAAADIAGNIYVAAELVTEFEEFVSAEAVILDDSAPVGINHLFSF